MRRGSGARIQQAAVVNRGAARLKQAVVPEPGRLIVLVTKEPEPGLQVEVRETGGGEPGYARASAAEWSPRMGLAWRQCTVSSEKPEPELTLITPVAQLAQSFPFE